MNIVSRRHLVIPDCQVKEGIDTKYLTAIGNFIVDKKPDVIVCLGDFADMPSLSSYDIGKKTFEGRRYKKDIEAVHDALNALLDPLWAYNYNQKKSKHKVYTPRMVMTLGNHENRIDRVIELDPKFDGTISTKDLGYESYGWEQIPFLEVCTIDGVAYSHYFTSGVLGRPVTSARALVQKKHMSCVMGHVQTMEIHSEYKGDGSRITGLFAGTCLTPDHKVLKADLTYEPLANISVGDKLVSFDEMPNQDGKRSRRYKTGTVLNKRTISATTYRVTLASGKEFKVTNDHLWLVKTGSNYNWRTTENLRVGTCIPKLLDEWEQDFSYTSGWLSGMYDGEGSLSERKTTGGSCMQLSISQKAGPVLDKVRDILYKLIGSNRSECAIGRGCFSVRINGGVSSIVKLLGILRPIRLISKFKPEWMGTIACPDNRNDKVVSISPIGDNFVVQLEVDEKTMIVEGYPHHNCYEHNEDYLGAQGNNYFRGVHMLFDVENGEFNCHSIPLNYIKKEYL